MRMIIGGAALVAGLLVVAVLAVRQPQMATTSQFKANDVTDVRALESRIDLNALPRQDILSEADE